jgi:hypothetical protein
MPDSLSSTTALHPASSRAGGLPGQVWIVSTPARVAKSRARDDGLAATNLLPTTETRSGGFRRIDAEFTPDVRELFRVRQAAIRHHGA